MPNLTEISGLPLRLDATNGALTSLDSTRLPLAPPAVRNLDAMRSLLATPDPGPDERPCYLMYRDVHQAGDDWLGATGLRYDITVTLPGMIGSELMKTAGHYHSFMPNSTATYPELYEVLAGRALFLLQKVRDPEAALPELVVDEVLLIGATAGDLLLIPSHCGHITINAGDEPLVVADLIAAASENHYGAIREAHGAAYYVESAGDPPASTPNPAYPAVPPLTWYPTPAAAGLAVDAAPLYPIARENPDRFCFLTRANGAH